MNNRLESIVDLKKYPIQDLNSPLIKELVKKCKSDLDQFSCSTIPNFILPKSLKIMNTELKQQINEVYMSKESINPYLNSKEEQSFKKGEKIQAEISNKFTISNFSKLAKSSGWHIKKHWKDRKKWLQFL